MTTERERTWYPVTVIIAGNGEYDTDVSGWAIAVGIGTTQRHINVLGQPWYAWNGTTHGDEELSDLYARAHAQLIAAYPEDDIPAPKEATR